MKSRLLSASLWTLVALLLPSCLLGGQTGQPDATTCPQPRTLAADDLWRGHTAAQLVEAFVGLHQAPLHWFEEPHGSGSSDLTPVELDDSVSIDVSYEGERGELSSCTNRLEVPVTVEITTEASGLVERGSATLGFDSFSTNERAELVFSGEVLFVSARLSPTDGAAAPEGFLEPRGDGAPGGSASFP